jgi:DNA-binding transcriptional LysR family regulator
MPFEQQVKALHEGSLDAGFSFAPVKRNGLQVDAVCADTVAAVLPAQHPLATKRQIDLKEVAREPLVFCGGEAGRSLHSARGGRSGGERVAKTSSTTLKTSKSY